MPMLKYMPCSKTVRIDRACFVFFSKLLNFKLDVVKEGWENVGFYIAMQRRNLNSLDRLKRYIEK